MNMKIIAGMLGVVSLLTAGLANAATVSLSPSAQTVTDGDALSLAVIGSDFPDGVNDGTITVTWDATILQLETTQTDAIVDGALTTGITNIFVFDTSTPGQLDFTGGIGLGDAPVGQGGVEFTYLNLAFTAIATPGTDVDVGLGVSGLWQDGTFTPIPDADITYIGATVTVNPVPVPPAVWLFGSGLLGLVGVARRRSSQASIQS